jgi:hypothetical protein
MSDNVLSIARVISRASLFLLQRFFHKVMVIQAAEEPPFVFGGEMLNRLADLR